MGTQGIPIEISKSALIEALKKNKGRVTYTARYLSMHHSTLNKLISADPELIKIRDELRNDFQESRLDAAEETIDYFVKQRQKEPTLALKASCYFLNQQGKGRGYTSLSTKVDPEGSQDGIVEAVQDIAANSRGAAPSGQKLETEQPILDQRPSGQSGKVSAQLGAEDPFAGFPPV